MPRYIVRPSGLAFGYALWDRSKCKVVAYSRDLWELSKLAATLTLRPSMDNPSP